MAGDIADLTVIRVDRDYYLMHGYYCAPGYLIWHSRDLVNWEPARKLRPESGPADRIWPSLATNSVFTAAAVAASRFGVRRIPWDPGARLPLSAAILSMPRAWIPPTANTISSAR